MDQYMISFCEHYVQRNITSPNSLQSKVASRNPLHLVGVILLWLASWHLKRS